MEFKNVSESKVEFLKGKINEKLGNIGKAHTNYLDALQLDPNDTSKRIRNTIDLLNHVNGQIGLSKGDKENYQN